MVRQSTKREPGGRKLNQPSDPHQMHTHTLLQAHYPDVLPWSAATAAGGAAKLGMDPAHSQRSLLGQGSPFPRALCGAVVATWVTHNYPCTASHSMVWEHGDPQGLVWSCPGSLVWAWWMAKAENVGWVVITENICIVYQAMKIMGFKRYIHGVQPASSCLRQPAAGTGKSQPRDKLGRRSCSQ